MRLLTPFALCGERISGLSEPECDKGCDKLVRFNDAHAHPSRRGHSGSGTTTVPVVDRGSHLRPFGYESV